MKKRFKQKNEKGRTMLETLGALAIMGLITAGGVQGYRLVMDVQRANATIDQAMQLAMLVSSQRRMGLPGTLTVDDSKKGPYEFSLVAVPNARTFMLVANEVPEPVRNRILETKIDNAEVSTSDDGSVSFTFNNNLGSIGSSSTHSGAEGGSDASSNLDTRACTNGNVYLSYNVGHECDTETPHKGDDDMECVKNSDCARDEYCDLQGDCDGNFTSGTCVKIGSYKYFRNIVDLGNVRISTVPMTWWSAENWCKAQGKSLIDLDEFHCYSDRDTNAPLPANMNRDRNSVCCKQGASGCNWTDGPDIESVDDANSPYSPVLVSLVKVLPSEYHGWWTATSASYAPTSFLMWLRSRPGVYAQCRNYLSSYHALCK